MSQATKIKSEILFYKNLFTAARKRYKSKKHYLSFQRIQAERVSRDLANQFNIKPNILLIDFGCGNGGYTEVFGEYYREVVGLDLYVDALNMSSSKVKYQKADLYTIRLQESADLIFCASVIEHTAKPELLIKNISENLKENGFLYLSFPPFKSIGGGHLVKPFHYLPESWAIYIARKLGRLNRDIKSYDKMYGSWGLYRRSIREVNRLLVSEGFTVLKCKPRFINVGLSANSTVADYLTWHVEFYCEKRA